MSKRNDANGDHYSSWLHRISDYLDIVSPSPQLVLGTCDKVTTSLHSTPSKKTGTNLKIATKNEIINGNRKGSVNTPRTESGHQERERHYSADSDWSHSTSSSTSKETTELRKRVDELQFALAALQEKQHVTSRRRSLAQEALSRLKLHAVLPIKWWWAYLKAVVAMVFVSSVLLLSAESKLRSGHKVQYGVLLSVGGIGALLAVPGAHAVGQYLHDDYRIWQPFRGGSRFVVLQGLSWIFYSVAVVLIVYGFYTAGEGVEGVLVTSGVAVLIAQCFMVSSLFTFNSSTEQQAQHISEYGDSNGFNHSTQQVQINEKVQYLVAKQYSFSTDSLLDHWESEDESDDIDVGETASELDTCITTSSAGNLKEELKSHQTQLTKFRAKQANSVVSQFVQMNVALMCFGLVLGAMAEESATDTHRIAMAALSLMCCLIAITLSHGLGGRMKHDSQGWRFFGSRHGGLHFVMLQTIGWLIFGVSLLCQASFIIATVYFSTKLTKGFMYFGGFAAVTAEFLVVLSLQYFQSGGDGTTADAKMKKVIESNSTVPNGSNMKHPNQERLPNLNRFESLACVLVLAFYCNTQYVSYLAYLVFLSLPHFVSMFIANTQFLLVLDYLTMGLIPDASSVSFRDTVQAWAMLLIPLFSWVLLLSALKNFRYPNNKTNLVMGMYACATLGSYLFYYRTSPQFVQLSLIVVLNMLYMFKTYTRMPEVNGGREWPGISQYAIDLIIKYFGARVVLSQEMQHIAHDMGNKKCKQSEYHQVMLGLHPHGVFPSTQVWLQKSPAWRKLLPNLNVIPTTASVTHFVPVMRDIAHWNGVRDVSRASIVQLLQLGHCPQIVVGGQSEMFESRSWDRGISVVRRRRRGMFRIAIQHGVGVVPMFTFGETETMDNIYMPKLQSIFKRYMGFPVPYWPHGRWFLPIPRRIQLTIAVGAPVLPIRKCSRPSEAEITEFHCRYFKALEDLFEESKVEAGYPYHYIKWMD